MYKVDIYQCCASLHVNQITVSSHSHEMSLSGTVLKPDSSITAQSSVNFDMTEIKIR